MEPDGSQPFKVLKVPKKRYEKLNSNVFVLFLLKRIQILLFIPQFHVGTVLCNHNFYIKQLDNRSTSCGLYLVHLVVYVVACLRVLPVH